MAKFKRPVEFTSVFGIDRNQLDDLGALAPALNVDTKLFIDPVLLESSRHQIISSNGNRLFRQYFSNIIKLVAASRRHGDIAWRQALSRLTVKENPSTCLGYGARTTHGNAIGFELAARLLRTASEIIELGVVDPDLFKLLPLLEDGMGPDRISDMTTLAMLPALAGFTQEIVSKLNIESEVFQIDGTDFRLPRNPLEKTRASVLLVPKDILKDLPIASDWSGVADAAARNLALKARINAMIGDIWEKEVRADKRALRRASLSSREAYEALLAVVSEGDVRPYNTGIDQNGLVSWRDIRSRVAQEYPIEFKIGTPSPKEAISIVNQIISQFEKLIDKKGLWKELWAGEKPRHERSAQRLFYAVADSYCEANNLEVTPEAETGNGPVDFKFSSSYKIRILVEIKLSTNSQLVHGYTTQLRTYREAEEPIHCAFLIIDVGKMGKKLEKVLKQKNHSVEAGDPASEITVIDGGKRPSASKR